MADANGTRGAEDVVGRIVGDLIEHPLVRSAIGRALEARSRAAQVQDVALGALNLPSAADIGRLTRRVRSVSLRLEGVEDAVDRLERRSSDGAGALQVRLARLEEQLAGIAGDVAAIRDALPGPGEQVSREQERFQVGS